VGQLEHSVAVAPADEQCLPARALAEFLLDGAAEELLHLVGLENKGLVPLVVSRHCSKL